MEVILLERVQNLGELGDKVRVKPGYGRNFLIPGKKAVPATPENIAMFEAKRAELEKVEAEAKAAAQARADKLGGIAVSLRVNTGAEGKLYGSVGPTEIVDALTAQGAEVEKREVQQPDGPIRMIGEYQVDVILHPDITVTVDVIVASEDEAEVSDDAAEASEDAAAE
ncbi:MAG: 50S ribosomal protein L9 [Gammaproteobacteria bacterium]|nr:50S ribosomal protein L9 [Gammaproteobacteria bacterium]